MVTEIDQTKQVNEDLQRLVAQAKFECNVRERDHVLVRWTIGGHLFKAAGVVLRTNQRYFRVMILGKSKLKLTIPRCSYNGFGENNGCFPLGEEGEQSND